MVTNKKLIWDRVATSELKEEFDRIKERSLSVAKKVKESILQATKELPNHPEIYAADRFKKNNDNTYRAFEKLGYSNFLSNKRKRNKNFTSATCK